ncbi:MAG: hypothetical protein AABZ67_00620 [Pseudomonadota bacterium]
MDGKAANNPNANIVPLKKDGAAPAIGTSLQVQIGDGRVFVLQTHFAQEATVAQQNKLLDRMFLAADRVKARYDLEAIEDKLAQLDRLLKRYREDKAKADAEAQGKKNHWEKKIADCLAEQAKIRNEDAANHESTGRRGAYQISQRALGKVNAFANDINRARAEIEKIENERKQHESQMAQTFERCEEDRAGLLKQKTDKGRLLNAAE